MSKKGKARKRQKRDRKRNQSMKRYIGAGHFANEQVRRKRREARKAG